MSWETIQNKEVKIKKPHRCHGCLEKSQPGDMMRYIFSVDGGDISSTYWCKVCDAFYTQNQKDFDEGVEEGEFRGEDSYNKFKEEYLKLTTKPTTDGQTTK